VRKVERLHSLNPIAVEKNAPCRTPAGLTLVVAGLVFWTLALTGCSPQVALTGVVTDTRGGRLPGVSVTVDGAEAFAVTNGTGMYGELPRRLTVPPGVWRLRFFKTGFTTAEMVVETGDVRDFEVPAVQLWPVPNTRGIFAFSGNQFQDWTRVEPTRFLREDRVAVYGTQLDPELILDEAPATIVGHKVPPYDWRLSRLEPVAVLREGATAGSGEEATHTIWAESVRISVQAVPIDEPERLLWELRPGRALGPGVYAVHWGAFEGDPTPDPSGDL
jgi:hypothetical protein